MTSFSFALLFLLLLVCSRQLFGILEHLLVLLEHVLLLVLELLVYFELLYCGFVMPVPLCRKVHLVCSVSCFLLRQLGV